MNQKNKFKLLNKEILSLLCFWAAVITICLTAYYQSFTKSGKPVYPIDYAEKQTIPISEKSSLQQVFRVPFNQMNSISLLLDVDDESDAEIEIRLGIPGGKGILSAHVMAEQVRVSRLVTVDFPTAVDVKGREMVIELISVKDSPGHEIHAKIASNLSLRKKAFSGGLYVNEQPVDVQLIFRPHFEGVRENFEDNELISWREELGLLYEALGRNKPVWVLIAMEILAVGLVLALSGWLLIMLRDIKGRTLLLLLLLIIMIFCFG